MRSLVLLTTLALLAVAVPASAGSLETEATCVPTNGGNLDYHSEACVDVDKAGCAAWHTTPSGTKCYAPVPQTAETCIPTNGGNLDYYSEACVDADNWGCRAWHESYNEYSGHQYTCYVPV